MPDDPAIGARSTASPRIGSPGCFLLAFAMLPLLGLFAGCVIVVQSLDRDGPTWFPAERLEELPADLEVVESLESCGQGHQPVDCGALVIIAGDAESDEEAILTTVSDTWCQRPWQCERIDQGRVVGSYTSFWGRQDSVEIWAGSIQPVPDWSNDRMQLDNLEQQERAWVALQYRSVRG